MAEFKLGRIRFIWKGTWTTSTIYYKDDIVRNGGNTYVCIKGHTAQHCFLPINQQIGIKFPMDKNGKVIGLQVHFTKLMILSSTVVTCILQMLNTLQQIILQTD